MHSDSWRIPLTRNRRASASIPTSPRKRGEVSRGQSHFAANSHPNFSFALRASSGLGVFDGGN
jgi:hypothetical protein